MGHRIADCFHNADHFMTDRNARNCTGNASVLDVQVAGADAGKGYLNDGIPLVHQHRLGLFG